MNSIVVYQSKSGFTKKYAQWIGAALGADICPRGDCRPKDLLNYDTIVYGGSLHAVGVSGVKLIKKNLKRLGERKIVVFACGASPYSEKLENELFEYNFSPQERSSLSFYYLRGGFDLNKLPVIDKFLMKLMEMKIRRTPEEKRSPDDIGMLEAMYHPVDFTDRENIRRIVDPLHASS